MQTLPTVEWTAALDRISSALTQTAAQLDRREVEWVGLTDPLPASPSGPLLVQLEARLELWDEHLTAATRLATEVEKDLEEREAAVVRWQQVFARWREMIRG